MCGLSRIAAARHSLGSAHPFCFQARSLRRPRGDSGLHPTGLGPLKFLLLRLEAAWALREVPHSFVFCPDSERFSESVSCQCSPGSSLSVSVTRGLAWPLFSQQHVPIAMCSQTRSPKGPLSAGGRHVLFRCDDNFIFLFVLLATIDLHPLIAGGCHLQDMAFSKEL